MYNFNLRVVSEEWRIVNATSRYGKKIMRNIQDQRGNLIYEVEEKLKVWQSNIVKLLRGKTRPNRTRFAYADGPEINISEIQHAIKMTKSGKALGPNNI